MIINKSFPQRTVTIRIGYRNFSSIGILIEIDTIADKLLLIVNYPHHYINFQHEKSTDCAGL